MTTTSRMFKSGEVLLIHFNEQPSFFVRVERIEADHKKGWWRLHMLILTIPLQNMVWILDDEQMRGAAFTMQGHPVRIEAVNAPAPEAPTSSAPNQKPDEERDAQVVSMFDGDE